jgi:hypothetical protein
MVNISAYGSKIGTVPRASAIDPLRAYVIAPLCDAALHLTECDDRRELILYLCVPKTLSRVLER